MSAAVHVCITDQPLSADAAARAVTRPEAGAIVVFCGITRTVVRLDYEAYRAMAEEQLQRIGRDCLERHGLTAVAAAHRVGAVGLGESSVVVAASAPHRTEAFAGASELIDRIKAEAPIWKREVGVEGSHWVAGTVPQPPFITGLDGSVAEPRQADRSRG
jgi:molybdopterin synthase catalytic subunit